MAAPPAGSSWSGPEPGTERRLHAGAVDAEHVCVRHQSDLARSRHERVEQLDGAHLHVDGRGGKHDIVGVTRHLVGRVSIHGQPFRESR